MNCKKCNFEIVESANFCSKCGEILDETEKKMYIWSIIGYHLSLFSLITVILVIVATIIGLDTYMFTEEIFKLFISFSIFAGFIIQIFCIWRKMYLLILSACMGILTMILYLFFLFFYSKLV